MKSSAPSHTAITTYNAVRAELHANYKDYYESARPTYDFNVPPPLKTTPEVGAPSSRFTQTDCVATASGWHCPPGVTPPRRSAVLTAPARRSNRYIYDPTDANDLKQQVEKAKAMHTLAASFFDKIVRSLGKITRTSTTLFLSPIVEMRQRDLDRHRRHMLNPNRPATTNIKCYFADSPLPGMSRKEFCRTHGRSVPESCGICP